MKAVFKIIAFLAGCILILLLAIGSNAGWMSKFESCFPNPYRYGDLYMLSNMPGYRIKTNKIVKPVIQYKNSGTALTIIGDSYTQRFDSSFFSSDRYHFIHWNSVPDTIEIDTARKNILIIESAERYIRWRFIKNPLLTIGTKGASQGPEPGKLKLLAEENLQFMLTNYDWEMRFKEIKTSISLNMFNRFSKSVAKPDGSGRLYLSETVDADNNASSFIKIPDEEIKSLVENLNSVTHHLNTIGFDEVYVSIIPNASTIYKTDTLPYNQFIPRIQNDSNVHFKFIELLKPFQQEHHAVFLCNDSHWNELGKMIWLLQVNAIIDRSSRTTNR